MCRVIVRGDMPRLSSKNPALHANRISNCTPLWRTRQQSCRGLPSSSLFPKSPGMAADHAHNALGRNYRDFPRPHAPRSVPLTTFEPSKRLPTSRKRCALEGDPEKLDTITRERVGAQQEGTERVTYRRHDRCPTQPQFHAKRSANALYVPMFFHGAGGPERTEYTFLSIPFRAAS